MTPTFTLNSSCGSHDPIFSKGFKAGDAAEPNSRADASNGRSCNEYEFHGGLTKPLTSSSD